MTDKTLGQATAACGRARADDQLKQFIEHKKREIKKLETFLNAIDWDNLTSDQEFSFHDIVHDIIRVNEPRNRTY